MKQGAPKGNQNARKADPMNPQLNTRCHLDEFHLVRAAAAKAGKKRSDFIRESVLAESRRVLGIAETVR